MVVPVPRLILAKLDVPQTVGVLKGADTVEVAVRTELYNRSEEDVVLHAPDAASKVFWHVLDERHREIYREKPEKPAPGPKGILGVCSLTLAAGHSEHETETLVLNAKKLKPGGTYTVRAEVWGQIAEAEFVAVQALPLTPLEPAGSGGKKTASKKTAGKKASAKKPTAKKTGSKGKAKKKS
jgi:hypothetical protein